MNLHTSWNLLNYYITLAYLRVGRFAWYVIQHNDLQQWHTVGMLGASKIAISGQRFELPPSVPLLVTLLPTPQSFSRLQSWILLKEIYRITQEIYTSSPESWRRKTFNLSQKWEIGRKLFFRWHSCIKLQWTGKEISKLTPSFLLKRLRFHLLKPLSLQK